MSMGSVLRRPGGDSGRGRPRDPGVDRAVLAAALEVLQERGYGGLTLAEVARRAGVGKPALYRRWAEKPQLVVEAIVSQLHQGSPQETGSTAADLLAYTEQVVTTFTTTTAGRVLPGLVADMAVDPTLAATYRALLVRPHREAVRRVVERGIARGDLRPQTDVDFILDVLAGPLFVRLLITGDPVDASYPRAVVDLVLSHYGTPQESIHLGPAAAGHPSLRERGTP